MDNEKKIPLASRIPPKVWLLISFVAAIAAWYVLSSRGVPKLSTDYRDDSHTRAQQDESTLRAVASWDRIVSSVRIGAKAGYAYTDMLYRYMYDLTGTGENMVDGIRSQSYAHTAFAQAEAEYSSTRTMTRPSRKLPAPWARYSL